MRAKSKPSDFGRSELNDQLVFKQSPELFG